jgi:hypothetical protein
MGLWETLPEEYLNGSGAGRERNPLLSSYFPLIFFMTPKGFNKAHI